MKTRFGSWWTRLLHGGVELAPVERALLERLVAELPAPLRATVEVQFEAYDLVQREADGRALNFYRLRRGRPDPDGVPRLAMTVGEAPLVRLAANVSALVEPVHAVLTAVEGRAFCVSLDRPVHACPAEARVDVTRVVAAWRSNFAAGAA
jgi:hypothetical protein